MTRTLADYGFHEEQDGPKRFYLRDDSDPALRSALDSQDGLEALSDDGRGSVYRVNLTSGDAVVRPYRRGGAAGAISDDTYRSGNRVVGELVALAHARESGLRVPEPLGGVWEERGKGFGGAIATRWVPGVTLQDAVASADARNRIATLQKCGTAIRALHDAGIYHADLQIRNILVDGDDVTLIDFDNARVMDSVSPVARARNVLRLRRSIEKNALPRDSFDAVCEGYGDIALPLWLRFGYRIKGTLSDLLRSVSP